MTLPVNWYAIIVSWRHSTAWARLQISSSCSFTTSTTSLIAWTISSTWQGLTLSKARKLSRLESRYSPECDWSSEKSRVRTKPSITRSSSPEWTRPQWSSRCNCVGAYLRDTTNRWPKGSTTGRWKRRTRLVNPHFSSLESLRRRSTIIRRCIQRWATLRAKPNRMISLRICKVSL